MFNLLQEATQSRGYTVELTDRHYNRWLDQIGETNSDGKRYNRTAFADVAFDVLDNDELASSFAQSEAMKLDAVNELWKRYRETNKRQTKVEDEESLRLSGIKSPSNVINVVKPSEGIPSALSVVQKSGYELGRNCVNFDQATKIRNPYQKDTARAKLWQQSFDRGVAKALGSTVSQYKATVEDEERELEFNIDFDADDNVADVSSKLKTDYNDKDQSSSLELDGEDEFDIGSDFGGEQAEIKFDLGDENGDADQSAETPQELKSDPIAMAGYISCAQIHELSDEEVSISNPFEPGSEQYESYLLGWNRCLSELGFDDDDGGDWDNDDTFSELSRFVESYNLK